MAGITFNPQLTTSPFGTFDVSTQGYYQGDFVDDVSTYQYLNSGQLASTVSQPIWGGMAITESLSSTGEGALGNTLALATTAGGINAFTVFTKASNAITTPGNTVPQLSALMTCSYFRLKSGARIKVAIQASLVASLEGGAVNQALFWDPALQQLTATGTAGSLALSGVTVLSVNSNSKVVSYNSGTGVVSWVAGPVAVIQI